MKSALRVAVAGAGFAGGLHLAGWKRVPNAEVVAICDPAIEKAEARAREFGVASVFRDADEMLETTRPDAIDIVAPMEAHVALCILAASKGVHILCQKPLAPTLAEAQSVARSVEDKVRLMVHENWRFRAHYRQVKRWLEDGALGLPVSATMQMRSSGLLKDESGVMPQLVRQPFFSELKRLLIGEVLIHHLDVLRWLLGPLRVVAARTGRLCAAVRGEDHAVILLEGHQRWALLDSSLVVPGAPPTPSDRFELIGTQGTVLLDGNVLRLNGRRSESITFDLATGYGDSYAAAIAHFAAALTTDAPFETGPADNVQTLALVEEAYALASPAAFA
jgi:D-apiose dehydrogenase